MAAKKSLSGASKAAIIIAIVTTVGGVVTAIFTNVFAVSKKKQISSPWVELQKDIAALGELQSIEFSALKESIRKLRRKSRKEHIAIMQSVEDNADNINLGNRKNKFNSQ